MNEELLAKLRRDGALLQLPGGDEGVKVTLQFMGQPPPLSRAERRSWLENHFAELSADLAGDSIQLQTGQLSASAQTIESACRVDDLPRISDYAQRTNHRIDVVRRVNAQL